MNLQEVIDWQILIKSLTFQKRHENDCFAPGAYQQWARKLHSVTAWSEDTAPLLVCNRQLKYYSTVDLGEF